MVQRGLSVNSGGLEIMNGMIQQIIQNAQGSCNCQVNQQLYATPWRKLSMERNTHTHHIHKIHGCNKGQLERT